MKAPLSSGTQNPKLESVMAKPLKDHAFAKPATVAEIVQKVSLETCLEMQNLVFNLPSFSWPKKKNLLMLRV